MKSTKTNKRTKISSQALREFADNRRIANKAVQKAVEKNKKVGIPDELQFEK